MPHDAPAAAFAAIEGQAKQEDRAAHIVWVAGAACGASRLRILTPMHRTGSTAFGVRMDGHTIDEGTRNFLLSVVRGVQPRDELAAILAVQMGAIHQANMMMARRLNLVDKVTRQDTAERALTKLARTYAPRCRR